MSVTLPAGARQLVDLGGGMLVVSVELETLREQDQRPGDVDRAVLVAGEQHQVVRAAGVDAVPPPAGRPDMDLQRAPPRPCRIVGRDDEDVLRALLANIVSTEDMLETGLGQDMFDVPHVDMDFHIAPSLGLELQAGDPRVPAPRAGRTSPSWWTGCSASELLAGGGARPVRRVRRGALQVPGVRRCEACKHRCGASNAGK